MQIFIDSDNENRYSNLLYPDCIFPPRTQGFIFQHHDSIVRDYPESGDYYYYLYAHNPLFQPIVMPPRNQHSTEEPRKKLTVPDRVREDCIAGRCKILLDHSLEGFHITKFDADLFRLYLGDLLPYTVFLTGDYTCSTQSIVNTRYMNYWERIVAHRLRDPGIEQHQQQMLNRVAFPKFRAICKNRLLRPHRAALVKQFCDRGLTDLINYSFGIVTEHGPSDALNYTHKHFTGIVNHASMILQEPNEPVYAWCVRHGEKNLYHETVNLAQNHASTLNPDLFAAHRDSCFEIVVETHYDTSSIFHSEKTFKSIQWMQPFVVCAEYRSVQTLRDLGYDVFDDFINHSYDNIQCPTRRLKTLVDEIHRLCMLMDSEWQAILENIKPRLIANAQHLTRAKERFGV